MTTYRAGSSVVRSNYQVGSLEAIFEAPPQQFLERAMSTRSAGMACIFTLLGLIGTTGCHPKPPPEPGAVVVRSEQLDEPKEQGVIDAPMDATYACYKGAVDEPLETFTLKKGEKLG